MSQVPARAIWNFWAWLASTSGLGSKTVRTVRDFLAQHSMDAEALVAVPPSDRMRLLAGLPAWLRGALVNIPTLTGTRRKQFENPLRAKNIRAVLEGEEDYPWRLAASLEDDAPFYLFCSGDLARLRDRLTIAMVGTRHPSPEGVVTARRYAKALSECGIEIVSGYARGIDTASHTGALQAGGDTTLVLAEGLAQFSPRKDIEHYRHASGLLMLSEFPLTARWRSGFAVRRNRSIVALSDGVIVVETGLRGGTAYAVRATNELKRPLFAVQYKHPGPYGAGNASLLASGAHALEPDPAKISDGVERIVAMLRANRDRLLSEKASDKTKPLVQQLDFTKRETPR